MRLLVSDIAEGAELVAKSADKILNAEKTAEKVEDGLTATEKVIENGSITTYAELKQAA